MNKQDKEIYEVIVVGAGHAGCEAALAAARIGCKTLILTKNIEFIGHMSCNPAIGGPAKGQIVGEIDALGGEMGQAADATKIQIKVLNKSRGAAVQCLRTQNDLEQYRQYMRTVLENEAHLELKQEIVKEIVVEKGQIKGIKTVLDKIYWAQAVVITPGTFLNGRIYVGLSSFKAGRMGETSIENLSESLVKAGLKLGRLKTGTPPRLDKRTIDYAKMAIQPGDTGFLHFSFKTKLANYHNAQIPCYLTYTTPKTHEIILNNLDRSPLYQKVIKGIGPRYCPSIEDKVVRFKDKEQHQLFIEPVGTNTNEIYPQGLNTSLPEDVQEKFLYSIPGLEKVKIIRNGYAVEYDFVYPNQLDYTLETRPVKGLYLAGQINGTSGYEEAAGQGLVAGINAALKIKKKEPLILTRENSYIGTMIDDLINKEIYEPYRMLTSRSEYRLYLRQDNALFRLGEKGYQIGLITKKEIERIRAEQLKIKELIVFWKKERVAKNIIDRFKLQYKVSFYSVFKRNEISIDNFMELLDCAEEEKEIYQRAFVEVKYEGYLQKQKREILKMQKQEANLIPKNFDYEKVKGLRKESREKFMKYRPQMIRDAKRIAGINPADISVLMMYLK
ncbi:tRNA uridine-5-carboxymethylaminomethyl(34) synthesis enzyme MnmG [bacterium]|nr:tRNA uridine-5-carboxymethylaminomethyl(34) synthesis enzyme MnmG [bacterium]